jgi:hypothetical protein
MTNSQIVLAVIAVAVLFVVLAVATAMRRRRSRALAEKFGPEYDRTVEAAGRAKAEAELAARTKRVEKLQIRPLAAAERERYAELWRVAQQHFVDNPHKAVAEADQLVTEVMRVRGYPMSDFEQRAADISVDHPHLVTNYRAAHAIAERSTGPQAGTEDLRQAMVHYRALFEDLLGAAVTEPELIAR